MKASRVLIYDTETTGLIEFKKPSTDPSQPHLVQLAAVLLNTESGEVEQSMNVVIRPEGFEIPKEVTDIHGITTEYAKAHGVERQIAIAMFIDMWGGAKTVVGFNEAFDARILRIAMKREGLVKTADVWKSRMKECACIMATKPANIPATMKMRAMNRKGPKRPTLVEACDALLDNFTFKPHDAMEDVRATAELYMELKRLEYKIN